jgi:hypothetical protein
MPNSTTPETAAINADSPPLKIHKIHKSDHPLSPQKIIAIHLLVLGQTDQVVADAVRVERSTITRWRIYDSRFQIELNRHRLAVWANHADRLRSLLQPALDILQNHLSSHSERAAFRAAVSIIRLASHLGPPTGPTDEYQLLKDFFIQEQRERIRLDEQNLWPVTKESLDELREYFLKKARNEPLKPPPQVDPPPPGTALATQQPEAMTPDSPDTLTLGHGHSDTLTREHT